MPPQSTSVSTHLHYLSQCLSLATKSPPKPTNFRVGAILLLRRYPSISNGASTEDKILSTGYTLELKGNTHAEQCCLSKLASHHGVPEDQVGGILERERGDDAGSRIELYVTMEPCGKRLSGNVPCAERIADTRRDGKQGIDRVFFGVKEPGTFVGESVGCKMLDAAGVQWTLIEGMEDEILKVAMEGHEQQGEEKGEAEKVEETNVDDITEEERRRQDALPRNPKKRMMEHKPGHQ